MRSSVILASLLAIFALANPVDKRALTTKLEIYTVYTTVTRGAEPTPSSRSRGHSRGHGRPRSSSTVAVTSAVETPIIPTSIEVVVPTPTPEAVSATYEAAPSSSEAPVTSLEASVPAPDPVPSPEAQTPAPEPPAPAAPSPAPVGKGASSSWAQQVLNQHNVHRANHTNTGPLDWSDALAATALKIANSCVYAHDTETDQDQYTDGYGQNIGAGYPPEGVPGMITNSMYNDEAPAYEGLYGQDNPNMSNFHVWGHFSQIAWRNTKEVGCATVKCDVLQNASGMFYFTVCNYAPPGNFGGQYTNVGTRLGKAPVSL